MVCLIPVAAAQSDADTGAADDGGPEAGPDAAGDTVDERELTFGDEGEDGAAAEPGNIDSFGVWDFVRMVIVLGIVIAAIYVVFYLLKRASGGRFENSPMIRVLGSHGLPGNKALHLVEVGRQVFLIGVGDDSISYISEISDQESLDELRLKASTTSGETRGSFADMLSGFFSRGGAGGPGEHGGGAGSGGSGTGRSDGNGASPSSFFESQKERLRRLR
jgi:flagellar protein FliO/FliZ